MKKRKGKKKNSSVCTNVKQTCIYKYLFVTKCGVVLCAGQCWENTLQNRHYDMDECIYFSYFYPWLVVIYVSIFHNSPQALGKKLYAKS